MLVVLLVARFTILIYKICGRVHILRFAQTNRGGNIPHKIFAFAIRAFAGENEKRWVFLPFNSQWNGEKRTVMRYWFKSLFSAYIFWVSLFSAKINLNRFFVSLDFIVRQYQRVENTLRSLQAPSEVWELSQTRIRD